MSISQDFLGSTRTVPEVGEENWGPEVTDILVDLLRTGDTLFFDSSGNLLLRERITASTLAAAAVLTPTAPVHEVVGDGAPVSITLAAGSDGQLLTLVGTSDTNTVTLAPSASLLLNGPVTLGLGDVLTLRYHTTLTAWIERSRSN